MGNQYRDTKIKEMFFEPAAGWTLFNNYVVPGMIIVLVIIILIAVFANMYTAIGISAIVGVITAISYWFWCSYKMNDRSANKSQIETAMFSAFSDETQKLDTSIAEGTYLTELISVSNNDGKSAAMTKLSNDMEKDNDQALGVWLKYAAESE
jgi:hypothetical protein